MVVLKKQIWLATKTIIVGLNGQYGWPQTLIWLSPKANMVNLESQYGGPQSTLDLALKDNMVGYKDHLRPAALFGNPNINPEGLI